MKNIVLACLWLALVFQFADVSASSVKTRNDRAHPHQSAHGAGARDAHDRHGRAESSKRGHTRQDAKGSSTDKFTVAIDAGHGGKDTGAIGPGGTREKDVVLDIARKLERLVRADRGMAAVMVRRGDRFIPLSRRAEIARDAGADLFVSLHADAYAGDDDQRGSSVFTLLVRGKERQRIPKETQAASNRAAGRILAELNKRQSIHFRLIKRARFAVLKSRDMPSTLVETGFVSNPAEERKLASPAHQEKVARCIFKGIRAYSQAKTRTTQREAKPVMLAARQ